VVIVVNDRRELYPEILERSGLRLVDRLERIRSWFVHYLVEKPATVTAQ